MSKFRVIIFLLLAGFLTIAMNPFASTNVRVVLLDEPNLSAFPDAAFTFRAISREGYSLNDIVARQIEIFENNERAEVTNLIKNPTGAGLNLYFVIDEFNRTDNELVSAFINRFASNYMLEGFDQVTILTNNFVSIERDNPFVGLPKTGSINSILSFSDIQGGRRNHQYVNPVFQEVYSLIMDDAQRRTNPTHIILLAGPETIFQPDSVFADVGRLSENAGVPLHVFELQHPRIGFADSSVFKELAEIGRGNYFQIRQSDKSTRDFTVADESFFQPLTNERLTYTVEYRSPLGIEGVRSVNIRMDGLNIIENSGDVFDYQVNLSAPQVVIKQPVPNAQITRTAVQDVGASFVYDKDMQLIEFDILWPDQFPRKVSSVDLEFKTSLGTETVRLPRDPSARTFTYEWDLRKISQEGDNPIELFVLVTDELGLTSSSQPIPLTVSNVIPPEIVREVVIVEVQEQLQRVNLITYILGGLVLVLLISLILLRKKIKNIDFKSMGDSIVNQVRKTFVPNSGRKNPVAVIKILTGPDSLLGEELSIYTEAVKLGRDPAQADFTFFSPDSKSTISGLHAEIRRQNGQWLLENYSSSGETVLNGSRIPDDQPAFISEGDRIRLGYLAQQCVEFEFSESVSGDGSRKDKARITDVQPVQDYESVETEIALPVNDLEPKTTSANYEKDDIPVTIYNQVDDSDDDLSQNESTEDFFGQYDF